MHINIEFKPLWLTNKGAIIGGIISIIALIIIIASISKSWNNVEKAEQDLSYSLVNFDKSLSDFVDACSVDVLSGSAVLSQPGGCDDTLYDRWNNQCQQYKTELSYSCGKAQGYLESRGII